MNKSCRACGAVSPKFDGVYCHVCGADESYPACIEATLEWRRNFDKRHFDNVKIVPSGVDRSDLTCVVYGPPNWTIYLRRNLYAESLRRILLGID